VGESDATRAAHLQAVIVAMTDEERHAAFSRELEKLMEVWRLSPASRVLLRTAAEIGETPVPSKGAP
jgi:hypothetical protein